MNEASVYGKLRKHIDSLPVGFPATISGVEIRLLKAMFSPVEASVALGMGTDFATTDAIRTNLAARGIPCPEPLGNALETMASKGSILHRRTADTWALMPFVVGMFELQLNRLTKGFLEDTYKYAVQGFGIDFLTTGVAQSRIIPIGESVVPGHKIASYDEFRTIIDTAEGRIAVSDCVCRKARDLMGGRCSFTDRRELCVSFRDFAEAIISEGWGREISREEAYALVELNQKEGLVMRTSNERQPQFLCGCCGDCCGLIGFLQMFKRPADFVQSNYRAVVDPGKCVGCGLCARDCPMKAITMTEGKKALVNEGRCIGCGVCVSRCKPKAVMLRPRETARIPPENTEELYRRLKENRPKAFRKLKTVAGAVIGLETRPFDP